MISTLFADAKSRQSPEDCKAPPIAAGFPAPQTAPPSPSGLILIPASAKADRSRPASFIFHLPQKKRNPLADDPVCGIFSEANSQVISSAEIFLELTHK
jgi:hypothetical protein